MKRAKGHRIKREKPETSTAFNAIKEEHDLAYYIHDRVELMHQVFSVLKSKDLRAMAPECVRRLSIDDLQELCTEELLGISSKRLLAVLDGAEPPSDTESSSQSSQEPMETISLDSISSDEELLSVGSKKKKHKHKRRDSKAKKHKKKPTATGPIPSEDPERSKASRAGLTVLELLELQARARAIRAQLQQEHAHKQAVEVAPESSQNTASTDSEVEIKEEAAEVVEISSDEEKPTPEQLRKALSAKEKYPETEKADKNATAATNNKNDPKTATAETDKNKSLTKTKKNKEKNKKKDKRKDPEKDSDKPEEINTKDSNVVSVEEDATKDDETKKKKEKSKKKDKRKDSEKDTDKPEEISTKDSNFTPVEIDATKDDKSVEDSQRVTKRVNDLVITVPQSSSRKIKLNRNKVTVSLSNTSDTNDVVVVDPPRTVAITSVVTKPVEKRTETKKVSSVVSRPKTAEKAFKAVESTVKSVVNMAASVKKVAVTDKEKNKIKNKTKKPKKKEKRNSIDEDHDEITLQLSDSEKMDLLEDFDRKDFDKVSSSSSDSESSSDSSDSASSVVNPTVITLEGTTQGAAEQTIENKEVETNKENSKDEVTEISIIEEKVDEQSNKACQDDKPAENSVAVVQDEKNTDENENTQTEISEDSIQATSPKKNTAEATSIITGYISAENERENVIEITNIDDIPIQNDSENLELESQSHTDTNEESSEVTEKNKYSEIAKSQDGECSDNIVKDVENKHEEVVTDIILTEESEGNAKDVIKDLSEGELSSNESSEVEAMDLKPDVVCISDEETPKKKKKKDKKSKKEKKKKSDFRESDDQNFYKDDKSIVGENIIILEEMDDVFEVLELSDDSSCYEVEGTTLSKEPTVEEIAALSAKIDEIEKEENKSEDVVELVNEEEKIQSSDKEVVSQIIEEDLPDPASISWKERYLGSKKVKKVLTTANLLNALRKKNKELKKKIEDSKKVEKENLIQEEKEPEPEKPIENILEEGSIDHYNTLEGSTKYVNPIPDPKDLEKEPEKIEGAIESEQKEIEIQVTGEMKKDAKQLLKMYKKLLKYNDMTKQKDPSKKKQKKKRKKEKEVAGNVVA